MAFLGSFLQYLIIMIILMAIAVAGFFVGKALRVRKNKKEALAEGVVESNSDSSVND